MKLWNAIANEPVLLLTILGSVGAALIEIKTELEGLEQWGAMAVIGIVLAAIARHLVTPTRKVNQAAQELRDSTRDGSSRASAASILFLSAATSFGFLTLLAALLLPGCAAFESAKPVLRTVDEAMAIILCKQAQAEKAGINFEDVRDAYCENREHFAPFLASARAGLAAAEQVD